MQICYSWKGYGSERACGWLPAVGCCWCQGYIGERLRGSANETSASLNRYHSYSEKAAGTGRANRICFNSIAIQERVKLFAFHLMKGVCGNEYV